MKYAPTILGGVLFFTGFSILALIDLPQGSPTRFLGLSIQDEQVHAAQVYAALRVGFAFALMLCGVLVPLVLQWDYSRKGTQS